MIRIVLLAALLAACGTRSEPEKQTEEKQPVPSPPSRPPPPLDAWSPPDRAPPLPKPTSPIRTPDQLLAYAFQTHGVYPIGLVTLAGVRPDGSFDPKLGAAKITTHLPSYAEDKIGPICPIYLWERGEVSILDGNCISNDEVSPPRCTVVTVWKRAQRAGVPTNGTAQLELSGSPSQWRLLFRSTKGDLTQQSVADDCAD